MSNYYDTLLMEQLIAAITPKSIEHEDDVLWSLLPEAVRPKRRNASRAYFNHCKHRRRGYLTTITPSDFLEIVGCGYLTEEVEAQLEERWCRGNYWIPLILKIKKAPHGDKPLGRGRWMLDQSPNTKDLQTAFFLAKKKAPLVRVQILHSGDEPATQECLDSLNGGGIWFGDAEKPPVKLREVIVCL